MTYLLQAVSDTTATQVVSDSSVVDSLALQPDHIGALSRDVGEAGRLLVQGKWDLFWNKLYFDIGTGFINFLPDLASALFVLVLFYLMYRVFGSILGRMLDRSKAVEPGLQNLLMKTYRAAGLTFIGIMVLANFNVNVTALLAGFSIVGIAVGFAAKDTVENFISGVTILLDRPFRVGDYLVIEGIYGTVTDITLRSTRIRTLNDEIMVMPNVQMVNQKLINHTMRGVLRVEIPFGIAYKEYPEQARRVVLELTKDDPRLRMSPPSSVAVINLNDSSIDMVLYLFPHDPTKEVPIRYEYIERIREALRNADIEIPFPHMQVVVDKDEATPHTSPGPAA